MMIKHSQYKETGVPWLGKIPSNWSAKRLKELLKTPLKYGANEPAIEENVYDPRYIRITDFGDDEVLKDETFKSLTIEKAKDYLLKKGDVLFARSGATVGKSFLFKNYSGLACYAGYLIKATPNKLLLNSEFLSYFTKSISYDEWKKSVFIQATIQNISAEKFDRMELPIPSLEEQTAIAEYLDTKTQAIDKKVSLLEKKIGYYQELRKGLINETVTKGLDKNVKLKDSGIDWIGLIPEHWEVKRFKSFASTTKGKNLETSDFPFDNALPLLSLEYLRNENVKFDTYAYSPDKTLLSSEKDLIIVWDGAAVGEILKAKKGFISSTIAKINFTKSVSSRFFYFLKDSLDYTLKSIPTGMGIPHLNPTILSNYPCPIPPLQEQKKIAEFLENKVGLIEKIITNIQTQIITLKELRKTLINDVVTGKIKVSHE